MNIEESFENQLNDLYCAEDFFIKIIPEMLAATQDEELRKALLIQMETTKSCKKNLIVLTDQLGIKPGVVVSDDLEKMIEDVNGLLATKSSKAPNMAMIIAATKRIAIFEIAGYITLCSYTDDLVSGSVLSTSASDSFKKALDKMYSIVENLKNIQKTRLKLIKSA